AATVSVRKCRSRAPSVATLSSSGRQGPMAKSWHRATTFGKRYATFTATSFENGALTAGNQRQHFGGVAYLQFMEDVLTVRHDRMDREKKHVGYLLVGVSIPNQPDDFQFASRKLELIQELVVEK